MTPQEAVIQISFGQSKTDSFLPKRADLRAAAAEVPPTTLPGRAPVPVAVTNEWGQLVSRVAAIHAFQERLIDAGLGDSYEAAHARLAVTCLAAARSRREMISKGRLPPLPAASEAAADSSYLETVRRLCEGLENVVSSYANTDDRQKQRIHRLWKNDPRP